jgi:sterol 14-demethylase
MSRKFRIVVDRDICQGHSVCAAHAPELFRTVDSDGPYPLVEVLNDTPPPELLEKAELAAELCPNSVIRIVYLDE